jgi:pyruvate formate lyase activating enzyme
MNPIPLGMSGTPKEAFYWETLKDSSVKCLLCPHYCLIHENSSGACGVRYNLGGRLFSANYGRACLAIDPVEKKPLYHWKPGSMILSLGTAGCNMFCPFCQNAHLSRSSDLSHLASITKDQVLNFARGENISSVAFTYNEPTVWFEFVLETSELLKRSGISVVLVTNGFISEEPLDQLLPLTDAMNIDLKSFSEISYRKMGGAMEPVLKNIERTYRQGVHLEITHLVVPGINDSMEEFEKMSAWISSISPTIPLHISRYFPAFEWQMPPTPQEDIEQRMTAASKNLRYVYSGNLPGTNNTKCPNCGETVIERDRYYQVSTRLDHEGACSRCKTPQGIVMR